MSESEDINDISTQGETLSVEASFVWIDPRPIAAGETIAPAKLTSHAALEFAALHLILGDLEFAEECLKAANEIGMPNAKDFQQKALIFSGVVGYGRCFKSGVRVLTLNPAVLHGEGAPFDDEIHKYLIALRDKHVAHSVNDFEQCEAIAIVIGRPGAQWRDGSAIGVAKKQSIGISKALIQRAILHISAVREHLEAEIPAHRLGLHTEFLATFQKTGQWEMAPLMKLSDRSKLAERRR